MLKFNKYALKEILEDYLRLCNTYEDHFDLSEKRMRDCLTGVVKGMLKYIMTSYDMCAGIPTIKRSKRNETENT